MRRLTVLTKSHRSEPHLTILGFHCRSADVSAANQFWVGIGQLWFVEMTMLQYWHGEMYWSSHAFLLGIKAEKM